MNQQLIGYEKRERTLSTKHDENLTEQLFEYEERQSNLNKIHEEKMKSKNEEINSMKETMSQQDDLNKSVLSNMTYDDDQKHHGSVLSDFFGDEWKTKICQFETFSDALKKNNNDGNGNKMFKKKFEDIEKEDSEIVLKKNSTNLIHYDIECCFCKKNPIVGPRYLGLYSNQYNFCQECYKNSDSYNEPSFEFLVK